MITLQLASICLRASALPLGIPLPCAPLEPKPYPSPANMRSAAAAAPLQCPDFHSTLQSMLQSVYNNGYQAGFQAGQAATQAAAPPPQAGVVLTPVQLAAYAQQPPPPQVVHYQAHPVQ